MFTHADVIWSNTHSQVAGVQVHLLLQLGQQLVVEGFQLQGGRAQRSGSAMPDGSCWSNTGGQLAKRTRPSLTLAPGLIFQRANPREPTVKPAAAARPSSRCHGRAVTCIPTPSLPVRPSVRPSDCKINSRNHPFKT